jgi:hypothetical protein
MTLFEWGKLARTVATACKEEECISNAMRELRLREDLITDPNKTTSFSIGDQRLKKHLQTLDSFKMNTGGGFVKRSRQQKQFHFWFTQALLPRFYGNEWTMRAQQVLFQFTHPQEAPNGLEKTRPEVLVITPRRYGKTWSIAMFVASLLINLPGIKITVFSVAHRSSKWLMQKVAKFIGDIEGGRERICKYNQEELFVSAYPLGKGKGANSNEARFKQGDNGTSEFYSFPASVDSKIIFCVCVCVRVCLLKR